MAALAARLRKKVDWQQIVALYELLMRIPENPVVTLNHAVAFAMTSGPPAGLGLLDELEAAGRVPTGHRVHAVRAQLLEKGRGPCGGT